MTNTYSRQTKNTCNPCVSNQYLYTTLCSSEPLITLWYVLYRSRSFHKSLNQNVYCLLLMDAVVVHWCVNQHYRGHLSTTWQTAKCQPSTGRPQTSSSLPRPYHAQWAMIAILVWFWYFWYWSWHIEMGDFRMKNYHWTLSFQILYLLTLYDLLLYLFF